MQDVFESGDRVVVRLSHRTVGMGMFRSRIGEHDIKGKSISWGAIAIFRMRNGKIAEQWVNRDEPGILLGLGVRGYLRFGRFLQFEVLQSGVRSQPCWFGALPSLNRANSPVSPLTGPRLLTALLREGPGLGGFELPESRF